MFHYVMKEYKEHEEQIKKHIEEDCLIASKLYGLYENVKIRPSLVYGIALFFALQEWKRKHEVSV